MATIVNPLSRYVPYRQADGTLKLLGSGGYAVVVHARDSSTGGDVALKLLFCTTAQAARRSNSISDSVRREVAVGRGVAHPNLVRLLDSGELRMDGVHAAAGNALVEEVDRALATLARPKPAYFNTHYTQRAPPNTGLHTIYLLSYEYLQCVELYDFVEQGPVPNLPQLFAQLACAVGSMHAQGFAHLDVKLENILVSPDGTTLKLTDFGLSETGAEAAGVPGGASPRGTSFYIAPEMHIPGNHNGFATDAFALGFTLLAAATGSFAWSSTHSRDTRFRTFRARGCCVSALSIGDNWPVPVPRGTPLQSLINSLLNPNPDQRATWFQILLHPYLAGHVPADALAAATAAAAAYTPPPPSAVHRGGGGIDEEEEYFDEEDDVSMPPLAPSRGGAAPPGGWDAVAAEGKEVEAAEAPGRLPSFIESDLPTRVEYEAWVKQELAK